MSGPAFDKTRQRPKSEVAEPWIQAGLIEPRDIDSISDGFGKTSKYLTYGSTAASLVAVPLLLRAKVGMIKTALGSTGAGLLGGLAGATYGASRMKADLHAQLGGDNQQILRKIQLFQALTLHSNDPVGHPLPPLPGGAQPAAARPPPGFLSPGAPSTSSPTGAAAEQAFRKPFPVPKYDDRPPPEQYVGFAQDDTRANGDSGPSDVGFSPDEPQQQQLGGSRLGSDMDSLERATHENPTSWALLRSRATLNTPSSASLPAPTTSPMSADFSTQSTAAPSISTSSVPAPAISQPTISLDLTPIDDDSQRRAREQDEFDALVDRQRRAGEPGGGQWSSQGVKRGETVW